MFDAIKLALAKRWFPEVFQKADAHFWMSVNIGDLRQWCGPEFPDVVDAARWLRHCEAARYRALGAPSPEMNMDIRDFREMLRRRRDATQSTSCGN